MLINLRKQQPIQRITVSATTISPMLLALLFIGLKLGKLISWSWWWVLSPLWMPVVIAIAVTIFFVALLAVIWLVKVSKGGW